MWLLLTAPVTPAANEDVVGVEPSPKFHVTVWVSSGPGSVKLEAKVAVSYRTSLAGAVMAETAGATLATAIVSVVVPTPPSLSVAFRVTTYVPLSFGVKVYDAPEPEALAGPAGATLVRCAGAVDFDRLYADMTAACGRVRAWYDRLIARPARLAARRAAQSLENTKGETAR